MIVLGLTGSIGMGKTVAAQQLHRLGVPVFDADAAVHHLTGAGGEALPAIAACFPLTVVDGRLDRRRLGDMVFADPEALRRLEAILHPLVRRAQRHFLQDARRHRRRLAALDIPLLFERGGAGSFDAIVVISCPTFLQTQRVLRRPGMTREKLEAIRRHQCDDHVKRRLADFVVASGRGRRPALAQLRRIVDGLLASPRSRRSRKVSP